MEINTRNLEITTGLCVAAFAIDTVNRRQILDSIYDYMCIHIGKTNMNVGAIIVHKEYGIWGHTPDINNLIVKVSRAQFQLQLGR